MVDSRVILFEHKGTKKHGFLRVKFNIIFINVAMKSSLGATGLRVKVDKDFGGIVISHE